MSKFNEIISSDLPVLVDFSAEWCSPCQMMGLILKDLSAKVNGRARILKVDIDKNPSAAAKYGVRSVPTLLIFKKGEIKWRHTGVVPLDHLAEIIQKQL